MDFLKSRIVASSVTKIQAAFTACKKLFQNNTPAAQLFLNEQVTTATDNQVTAKPSVYSGTKSRVSDSWSAVWSAELDELEEFLLSTYRPTKRLTKERLPKSCAKENIKPIAHEVIVEQPEVHEECEDEVIEVLPLPTPDNQVVAVFGRNVETDYSEVPVNEILPTPDNQAIAIFNYNVAVKTDHSGASVPVVIDSPAHRPNPWIVDISWETCNPTAENIYYTVQAKASYHANSDRYVIVGPYNPASAHNEFEELELPPNHPLAITQAVMHISGYRMLVGKWLIPGYPLAILLDIVEAQGILASCLDMIESNFPTEMNVDDSLATGSIVFGFMVGALLNILNSVLKKQADTDDTVLVPVLAHFHEWTSGTGIMMMKLSQMAKGVATVYTEHESPFNSLQRTECLMDWLAHRDLLNNFAMDAVDQFIEHLPQFGDDIDSMYEVAITACQDQQLTLHFDITSSIDYYTVEAIQQSAVNQDLIGRYFVLTPMYDEANVAKIIDEVELPDGSPLAVALQTMRFYGYKIVVGKLKIPGEPYIILFDVLDAREDVFNRVAEHFRPTDEESRLELYNDKNVFRYLLSHFFSSLNNETFRQKIRTGQNVPKVIRIYEGPN